MKRFLFLLSALTFLWLTNAHSQVVYNYTGSIQSYTVPTGVTSIEVLMWGGGGAGSYRNANNNAGSGGSGAFVKGSLTVTPGQVLYIVVGGGGTYSTTNGTHAGGYGGGGAAYQNAGSGGGYSGIFVSNTLTQANARAMAGGGGGGGYGRSRNYGGAGGATTGTSGGGLDATHTGGSGGTIAAGGAAGTGSGTNAGTAGSILQGGTGGNNTYGGAGGGGGYYGGGGGYGSSQSGGNGTWGSGGGGGASFTTGAGLTAVTNIAGNTNTSGVANNPAGTTETYYNGTAGIGATGNGSNGNPGLVVIKPVSCTGTPSIASVSISATTGAPNSAITLTAVFSPIVSGLTYQWQSGPAAAGPWTDIAGATANPSTVFAPATLGTTTYYRLVVTCSNSGLSANSSTTLSFTTSSACNPTSTNGSSYIDDVWTTGFTTNINTLNTGYTTGGYISYYNTQQVASVPAGTTLTLNAYIFRGTNGTMSVSFYIDWNNDGIFDPDLEYITYYTTGANGNYAFALNIPSNAPLGDHRLRMIADRNAVSFDPCLVSSGRGEAEDYKITISANNCNTSPTSTPNSSVYYINQVAFIGTPVTPPANNTGAGLVAGYSNYTGLAVMAEQEQGEGVNVYVSTGSGRAKFAAWVDWDNNGIFSSPSECVYYLPGVHTGNTTFGFQIPVGTTPGNYKVRIRSFNYLDDLSAPNSIITPCGALYNGETEDYLIKVLPRCNARIAGITGQTLCGSGAISFTLGATGTSASNFNWYSGPTGGSPLPGSTSSGGVTSFTTPAVSSSTPYYVAATGVNSLGAACESPRVVVVATHNANISLTFNPAGPIFVCQGAGLSLASGSSTETKTLVNEDFESGGLGQFSVINATATPSASVANMQWRNRTSVYIPTYASVWQPAISSGFGTNKFALAVSDIPNASLNTSLQLTNAVNTVGFTNLTLEYDIFYDSYLGTGSDGGSGFDSVRVEFSSNNFTTVTAVQSFIIDQGIGTQFLHQSIAVPASFLNQSNLKMRFRYRANWVDGVAVDNIKLYGTTPTSGSYTWTPVGPGADINSMFLDAAYTQPYIAGTNASGIYINPTVAQVLAGTQLDFQASLILSNGCNATGTITVKLNEKVWTGSEDTNWHNPGNWCGDIVPTSSTSVLIPASAASMPVISAAAFARKIEVEAGASLTINNTSTSLSVTGDFTNNGTLTNNGIIILNGSSASLQNFPGSGTIAAMNRLEINNTGAGVALNKNIFIENELKPTAGNLALGNYDITIRSNATQTARVSIVGGTAGFTYGTGRFEIQRYLPSVKAWRFLATPVDIATSPTITSSWRESGSLVSTGYGTQITGPAGSTGMDETTPGYSMKWYNMNSNDYSVVSNTSDPIANKAGYMVYVRGDRAVSTASVTSATNLRIKGHLRTGNQSFTVNGNSFQSIGNPYASAISIPSLLSAHSNLAGAYYAWDPSLNGSYGVGGYQTLSSLDGFEALVSGSTLYPVGSLHPNVQSGQAFFIRNFSGTVINGVITETMKVSGSDLVSREETPADRQFIRTKLFTNTNTIADGNMVAFDDELSNAIDGDDALKFSNSGENFGMSRLGKKLSVEARTRLLAADTIQYNMSNLREQAYRIMIAPKNISSAPVQAYFIDKFLHTETLVSLSDTSWINITVSTAAASKAADRFMLVFKPSVVLPVTITSVSAGRNADRSIAVKWTVENEVNIVRYEVQRSADGSQFTGILQADAANSHNYTKNDLSPLSGDNFYRIKATSLDGQVQYSNIVKVAPLKAMPSISVYPNPVTDKKMSIRFTGQQKGTYGIQLFAGNGQLVYSGSVNIQDDNSVQDINLGHKVSAGSYLLKITAGTEQVSGQNILIQ